MKKTFYLTNSMSGKREVFSPADPKEVLYYSCGPTVYGPTHIGNARALLFGDLMFRWLKHAGFGVKFVRNYTDVDDKIITRANEEKKTAIEVADEYVAYCEEDLRLLGASKPTQTVRVTESIPEIIEIIQKILDRKHAYVVNGEVFFSIESFEGYGKLSGKKIDDLLTGVRIEVDSKKKNPLDFTLWKPAKPGEPFWESPWGKGRPGWHIECSAMISKWLGETIDLHHGGPDLIFPHHENEIAQSEAASGKTFCSHWVHHAFLTAGNEKMSKSLGNILTTREFIQKFGAEVLKFIYLQFHYRSMVPYTEEMMTQALHELERIYQSKKLCQEWLQISELSKLSNLNDSPEWQSVEQKILGVREKIEDEMYADLNTPGALGHLFTIIREINRVYAAEKKGSSAVAKVWLDLLTHFLNPLWNVFGEDPTQMLEKIENIRHEKNKSKTQASGQAALSDAEIQRLIDERKQARQNKDFKRSDEIRNLLDAQGIQLVDSPQGTTWKSK